MTRRVMSRLGVAWRGEAGQGSAGQGAAWHGLAGQDKEFTRTNSGLIELENLAVCLKGFLRCVRQFVSWCR